MNVQEFITVLIRIYPEAKAMLESGTDLKIVAAQAAAFYWVNNPTQSADVIILKSYVRSLIPKRSA